MKEFRFVDPDFEPLRRVIIIVVAVASALAVFALGYLLASELYSNISSGENETYFKITSVVDGDTVKIDYYGKEELVRLIGVNTPEVDGPYTEAECFGNEASAFTKERLSGKWVTIERDNTQDDRDKYDRLLRYVYLDNRDFGSVLINEGYAYEYTYGNRYAKQADYLKYQDNAKNNNRGLWAAGVCDASSEEEEVVVEEDTDTSTDEIIIVPDNSNNTTEEACLNIKGNISLYTGERIYHLPWQKYYNNTVISPEYGERYFCTEEEAINAGWRRSKE